MADQPQALQCGQCGYRATLVADAETSCPRCGAAAMRPAGETVVPGARTAARRQPSILLSETQSTAERPTRRKRRRRKAGKTTTPARQRKRRLAAALEARAEEVKAVIRDDTTAVPVWLLQFWRFFLTPAGRWVLAAGAGLIVALSPTLLEHHELPAEIVVAPDDQDDIAAELGDFEYQVAMTMPADELAAVPAIDADVEAAAASSGGGSAISDIDADEQPPDDTAADSPAMTGTDPARRDANAPAVSAPKETEETAKAALGGADSMMSETKPATPIAVVAAPEPPTPTHASISTTTERGDALQPDQGMDRTQPSTPSATEAASPQRQPGSPAADPEIAGAEPAEILSQSAPVNLAAATASGDRGAGPGAALTATGMPSETSSVTTRPPGATPEGAPAPLGSAAPMAARAPRDAPTAASSAAGSPPPLQADTPDPGQPVGAAPAMTTAGNPPPVRIRDPIALALGGKDTEPPPIRAAEPADGGTSPSSGAGEGGASAAGRTPPPRQDAGGARCPPGESAGRAVVIFDASLSMGLPTDMPRALEVELDQRMESGDMADGEAARAIYRDWLAKPGLKRLEVAQSAFSEMVGAAPDTLELGVVTFTDCAEIEIAGPVEAGGRAVLTDRVNQLEVRRGGDTPLAGSLDRAAQMLGTGGNHIIIITDGQETCGGDPCAAAADLKSRIPDLQIDLIDLAGGAPARCVPRLTGGRFIRVDHLDAADTLALTLDAAVQTCHSVASSR